MGRVLPEIAGSGVVRRRAVGAVLAGTAVLGGLLVGLVVLHAPMTRQLAVPTSSRISPSTTVPFDVDAPRSVSAVRHGQIVCFYGADAARDRLVFPPGYSSTRDLRLDDGEGVEVAAPGGSIGIAFGNERVETPSSCGSEGRARAVTRIAELLG